MLKVMVLYLKLKIIYNLIKVNNIFNVFNNLKYIVYKIKEFKRNGNGK